MGIGIEATVRNGVLSQCNADFLNIFTCQAKEAVVNCAAPQVAELKVWIV